MKRLLILLLASLLMFVGYLLRPTPLDPVAYLPPSPPALEGKWQANTRLKQAELVATGQIFGPEDVDVDAEGRLYGGLIDGRIVRVLADGTLEEFANTGGRPLGLHFDINQNLVVADAIKGLLRISPAGAIETLLTEVDGTPLGFTDDLDIASDGTIYFSDASSKFGVWEFRNDMLEARPWGRLISYQPTTGESKVLMHNLYFANGVALSQNEDFVLVNETWRYRIMRYWLSGEKAGTSDVFAENLPGFPDGISSNKRGTFWLALPTLRNATLDAIHPHPWLKNLVHNMPLWMQPQPQTYGFVVALDESGEVLASYHDPEGDHLHEITSVEQKGDTLYFGSLHNDRIGRLKIEPF